MPSHHQSNPTTFIYPHELITSTSTYYHPMPQYPLPRSNNRITIGHKPLRMLLGSTDPPKHTKPPYGLIYALYEHFNDTAYPPVLILVYEFRHLFDRMRTMYKFYVCQPSRFMALLLLAVMVQLFP